ncbi:DUF5133 domain-containing protein [Streptomyces sp. NPDC006512]|uniref:DUF5133 domain-containing protein n=1 Tax=Streptomyces sp. NPDC006512 TaxID=3154307 RepID=UPI0033A5DDCA
MSVDVLPSPGPQGATAPEASPLPEPAVSWAVGMLMATVPGPAHVAERVLSTAAAQARLTVAEFARGMAAGSRGTLVAAHIDGALHRAVRAAQQPGSEPPRSGPYLMPTRADAAHALGRFYDARARLVAAPTDDAARRTMEDAVYTLCVLMAQPSAHAAEREALQYTQG